MRIQLFRVHSRPDDYAVSKTGCFTAEGPYFLDFSRPLEKIRWLGFRNRHIGFTVWLIVPVVHAAEDEGAFVVGVGCADPYYYDILRLWKERHPSNKLPRLCEPDELRVIGDFADHFPNDCKT